MKVTFLLMMAVLAILELIRLTGAINFFKLKDEGTVDLR